MYGHVNVKLTIGKYLQLYVLKGRFDFLMEYEAI